MIRRDDAVEKDARQARGAPSVSDAGSRVDAGPTTEAGPLGRVDPARPAAPGSVPRPPIGSATMTDIVGGPVAGIASLVVGAALHARPKWWPWHDARTPESSTPDGSGAAAVR